MGRGGRNSRELALSPFPPAASALWKDAFSQFEQKYFHEQGESGCDSPVPYTIPRMVTLTINATSIVSHVIRYYETPVALLTELILSAHTLKPPGTTTSIIDCLSDDFKFVARYNASRILGTVACNSATLCIRQTHSKNTPTARNERIARANAISAAHDHPLLATYTGLECFILVKRRSLVHQSSSDALFFQCVDSVSAIEEEIGYVPVYPSSFLALYDLDVSDQPVPVRLGLRYHADDGVVHEVSE